MAPPPLPPPPLCVVPGWGFGQWGLTPWSGAAFGAAPGGPLPTEAPFDLYCVGPCAEMSNILTYAGVSTVDAGGQFTTVPVVDDLQMGSGGGIYPAATAILTISSSVTQSFTLEFTAKFTELPANFSSLVQSHIYFGVSAAAANCFGLFVSAIGLAYGGMMMYDGSNNLIINSSIQQLPGSQAYITPNQYTTFRIAVDGVNNVTYIYITETALLNTLGHQLRYVLPGVLSSSCLIPPPNRTVVSVCGTATAASVHQINTICLGSGLIMPALLPIADPGVDRSARKCEIFQLDGSASFDPQGGALSYSWRLLDAPLGSQWRVDGFDGLTTPFPVPTGFTNKFRSPTLEALHALTPIPSGTVLVVQSTVNQFTGITGTDIDGFYFLMTETHLPDSLGPTQGFVILYQNGISGATTVKPTFYPDLSGLYKFDLIVFNGSLFSLPATIVIDVLESPVPRGCIPDVSFLWNYLSDFWKLVDNTEPVDVFWSGLAQVAATELLTLWQHEYSKSLKDVQRAFTRRWLRYDLEILEPLVELTTLHIIYPGIESGDLAVAGTAGLNNLQLRIITPLYTQTLSVPLVGVLLTPTQIADQIQTGLQAYDKRFTTRVIDKLGGVFQRVRIDAPFPFEIAVDSQLPDTVFLPGTANSYAQGSNGVAVGNKTYIVERSLVGLSVQKGDILLVGGVGYSINRLSDVTTDTWPFQRIILDDELPFAPSKSWSIGHSATSKWIDFHNALVTTGDVVEIEVIDNLTAGIALFTTRVLTTVASTPGALALDLTPVGLYLLDTSRYLVHFHGIVRRQYMPIDALVVDVPYLQEKINNAKVGTDAEVLRRNIDYYIDTFRDVPCLRFVVDLNNPQADVWQGETPPSRMWAEYTYLNNNPTIEQNFGIPAEFSLQDLAELPSNADYLSIVRGLWYSYFNGPTMRNLRVGTQILLGLPFAEEAGQIAEIRNDFTTQHGRILVRDMASPEIVRSYTYPKELELEINPATGVAYKQNDVVKQFDPLVKGAEVVDYVKDPLWYRAYLQQGNFFEVEKFFKFLVRVDSAAFNLSALLFVKNFILKIKPTYTYPLFVVQLKIGDTEVSVSDSLLLKGNLNLVDGFCGNLHGVGWHFDEPDPSPGAPGKNLGAWQNVFDDNSDPLVPVAVFPNPNFVDWGYDKVYLCPEDVIVATMCTTFLVATIPPFDSIFAFDTTIYTAEFGIFQDQNVLQVPGNPASVQIGNLLVVGVPGAIDNLELQLYGNRNGSDPNYTITLYLNAVAVASFAFVLPLASATVHINSAFAAIPVVPGDIIGIGLQATTPGNHTPYIGKITVIAGASVTWAFDTALPAGTYCTYKTL